MELKILDIKTGREVEKRITELNYSAEELEKGEHEHYMLKEILEQPRALRRALMQEREEIMRISLEILRARQVVITASGTSRHASLIGRYLFSKIANRFCEVVAASEFQYFSESIDKNTLVIAVSQSGETADVLQGVKRARECGARVLSVVNVVGSTLERMSDDVIHINAGPEIAVASTKAFINQLAVFYMLSYAMISKFEEIREKLRLLSVKIEHTIEENKEKLRRLAELTRDKKDFYYIARGINFAVACEGALKLKEISYVHAEGMPAGELKHGTLALIESGTPVVAIAPNDYTFTETLNNVEEARARGAFVIGVSDERSEIFDEHVVIPKVEEIFYPVVATVPLQLFAYYHAALRGLNPDKPRNLAKSVTVK